MTPYRDPWQPPIDPPPSRLLRLGLFIARNWAFVAISIAGGLSLESAISACAGAQPTPTQEAAPIEYAAELEACIDKATTLAESQACRAAVRAKWGRK